MPDADHDHVVNTGKSELRLDDLGTLVPGLARLMPEVGDRIWKCYYAGKARNVPLARFQLKEAVNVLKLCMLTRPKYTTDITTFIDVQMERVRKAIDAGDWATFDSTFDAMIETANHYHSVYDKPWLRYKVPDSPPPDLDMTPL